MNALPVSLLYTRDAALRQRIGGLLHNRANVRVVQDPPELELLLHQHHGMVVFMDLRAADCARLLPELMQRFPEVVLIALGGARSDPGLYAAATGVYAIESANPDRLRLQTLFDQAQSHLRLLQENRLLRENRAHPPVSAVPERAPFVPVFDRFVSAYKRFDNVGIMLESLVEGIAAYARVARVAVFSIMSPEVYRFRAGVKCLEETRALEFSQTHPFVQWLQLHAHSLSRAMLRHIEPVEERLLLEHMLDLTGAEAILPLFGRQRLVGWLCLGRMITGAPLERCDIEELIPLAEQVSVTIENALLHESLAEQKALAETLLQTIPVGIIATGPDGTIRWFNRGAETLLKMAAAELIGQPVERHSSFLGSLLKRCMAGAHPEGPVEWTDPATGRALGIQLRRLSQDGQCMGALALIQDLTEERIWREKQNNLERATFWNELASAISHEVRNPLVAISTLAQLLPERYNDQEFRTQFRDLTTQEVSRLNGMIDQLDQYANPPGWNSPLWIRANCWKRRGARCAAASRGRLPSRWRPPRDCRPSGGIATCWWMPWSGCSKTPWPRWRAVPGRALPCGSRPAKSAAGGRPWCWKCSTMVPGFPPNCATRSFRLSAPPRPAGWGWGCLLFAAP